YDWQGFIPFAELPQAENPAAGHFISANNQIVPADYPYFLSRDWDLPNRAERIGQLLAATPQQSPATSAAIETDTLSLAARRLVPLMSRIAPANDMARRAIERLRNWDFRMDADKVAPLLFVAWLRDFARDVFFTRLGDDARDYWDLKPAIIEAVLRDRPDWCGTPLPNPPPLAGEGRVGAKSCDAMLSSALDAALAALRQTFGADMSGWQWRRAHIAVFDNPVLGQIPLLRDWAVARIATAGGFDTVNRGSTTIHHAAHPYEQRFGAGLRVITDLASPADSRMIAVPGQSGNPLSPHFSDLLERWRDFDYLVPGRAAAVTTLTLEPAP
ncbi:MAG TPA: penicillin acylase family protein, partial [Stellaceae bacterium]|nr:penicillin acylase family protein [Stellaceae bacterium]